MSGKKFPLKKFAHWRREQLGSMPPSGKRETPTFPVDWEEFNKMYFSSRHVVVEYSPLTQNRVLGSLALMGFYSALKVATEGSSVGMCNFGQKHGFPYCDDCMRKLTSKTRSYLFYTYNELPEKPLLADEWVLHANWSPIPDWSDNKQDGQVILEEIVNTKGFRTWLDKPKDDTKIVIGWEGKDQPQRKRKVLMAWDSRGKEGLDFLKENYKDDFVFIPYTKEKNMVDTWFENNDAMLDPGFDIKLMEPGLNQRKILLYVATNHLYAFREYARVFPEVVGQFLTKQELKELL
jgi:hypothetical protein